MIRLIPIILFLLSLSFVHAQDDKTYFSEAIGLNIKSYKKKVSDAYRYKDIERAEFLFDSLVNHCLKGSYIDNFSINCLNKNKNCFNDYEKPIFLLTYASWCVPGKGEIPALNEVSKKYKDQIDFIVLFWDKKSKVRKVAREYNNSIDIVYVDELENRDAYIVKTMKHSLGFPTTFFIGSDKQIVDISRTVILPYNSPYEKSYTLNYQNVSEGVSQILEHEEELLNQVEFTIK
ncbi:redoxin domain-containing protein [Mesonia sp.]|uniref:TlpA family protein disulfide reductase n=1 Tax=Mesonia sp. TaxID=1960830 RepID=UPI001759EED2|nr:redoxin domain-containing protein [Mesonia sp.]HIB37169.1 redoxin domain-containing protein [Mesonia sp.]HIO27594.1 redoxin domain-containing protein [Flavobacteriaceae bacterium]